MEGSRIRPITSALVLLVLALTGYVGLALMGPIDLPWQRVTATLQLEPIVDGDTVRVRGTTDLPDGALIDYWFWRDDAINEGPAGVAEVRDGKFSFEHDVSGLRRGMWEIQASFSTMWGSAQPQVVTDRFGADGEHLAGPQVYVDSPGDAKQLLVTTTVDLP
jgi:hypothetical protein